MAALIARISRQNRERKLRLREELPTSKSNYVLVPFDKNFVPSRDNNVSFKKVSCTVKVRGNLPKVMTFCANIQLFNLLGLVKE